MPSSRDVIKEYLRKANQLVGEADSVEHAGGTYSPPTEEDNHYLERMISRSSSMNLITLCFALCLVAAVFVVVTVAIVRSGSVAMVLKVVGIGGGSEAGLLAWTLRAWSEYNRFEMMLILCRRLSPEDLMKAMLALNDGLRRGGWRGGRSSAPLPLQ
jgi:hypothetical protein